MKLHDVSGEKAGRFWRVVQILEKSLLHGEFSKFGLFPEGRQLLQHAAGY